MFQDIEPRVFYNEYKKRTPQDDDYVVAFRKDHALLEDANGGARILRFHLFRERYPKEAEQLLYLFSIDDAAFFLAMGELEEKDTLHYHQIRIFTRMEPGWLGFAGATAAHLYTWYNAHRYCGRCAGPLTHKEEERALFCVQCGQVEYPRISPVVIVGVTDGEKLLLTKYSGAAYKKHALIAGFMEIGETPEDTVHREVMEEVGLQVKNLRYYKSQPWAFSESMLLGFYAEVDGERQVRLDERELSEAEWFAREDIPADDSTLSLTWSMIEAFRNGEIEGKKD